MKIKFDKKNSKKRLLGLIIAATSITLSFIWYDWKLILIIFLFSWANNIDQNLD